MTSSLQRLYSHLTFACCSGLLLLGLLLAPTAQAENHTPNLNLTTEEQAFIQNNPEIVVGGETAWAPLDFVKDGIYTGVAKEYLDLISERTGLTFVVKTGYDWHTLLRMLQEQRLDMLPILAYTSERAQMMNYTRPYMKLRRYAFVRSGREDINRMEDLAGKIIAVPRGYSYLGRLEIDYPTIRIKPVSNTLEAIDAVLTNRADAVITGTPLINYYMKENYVTGLRPAFQVALGVDELHMATRKDLTVLRSIIQKALDSVDELSHKQIMARWTGMQEAPLPSVKTAALFTKAEREYLTHKQQLKACIDPDWMPYEGFVKGHASGMSSDYLSYFSQQLQIPITVVPTKTWTQSLEYAQTLKCDLLPLASNRPERQAYLNFTPAYVETSLALATRDDGWFYSDFSEIQYEKVGIIRGYSPATVIRQKYPNIHLVELDSVSEGLTKVRKGELLGFLDAIPTLSHHIQKEYPGQLKISGKFDYAWNVGLAARNDEPLLISVMNKVITHMPESVHQRIRNNWLAVRYEEVTDYSLLWKFVSIFAVILFLLILRYRQVSQHKDEISQKNAELALINQQLEQQTEAARHMAFHDLLTGLPNRSQLLENLDHALKLAKRQNHQVAVLFLDLDRFKYVNDSLGHHIGDELLKLVAHRVKACLRPTDTLARLGGDEFVVVLESVRDNNEPAKVAQHIIDTLQQPMDIAGYHLNISASAGIAFYPGDAQDIHTLIKNADNAMYEAKELGRNHFRYFTKSLSEETEKRLKTESALREALPNNQLTLVFQPIIDLNTMEVSHAEALIRWQHPELGFVSPEYFIPIAEENGLINEIGLWVAKEACKTYKEWLGQGLQLNSVAINVSSMQFQKGDFTEQLQGILRAEGLDARSIEIEITERYLMDQTERNMHHLNALKDAGHLISVDDFGVGYSSMSYMKTLPLDIIKIDRSFINDIAVDPNDRQITQAIVSLSHNLGYRVIAEGVENDAQLSFLQQSRCDFAQGYLFSRPVSADDFIAVVERLNHRLKISQQQALELILT